MAKIPCGTLRSLNSEAICLRSALLVVVIRLLPCRCKNGCKSEGRDRSHALWLMLRFRLGCCLLACCLRGCQGRLGLDGEGGEASGVVSCDVGEDLAIEAVT